MNNVLKGAAVVGGVWFASACAGLFACAADEEINEGEILPLTGIALLLGPLLLPVIAGDVYREHKLSTKPKPEGLEVQ